MCGIVGYTGTGTAVPIILEGLKRLEYRGYDSSGIAVCGEDGQLSLRRAQGKLHNLEEVLRLSPMGGSSGIGHTRWATHGRPTEDNAHPHRDCKGELAVVHNGIVENYLSLKQMLQAEGHAFRTQTDTEVIAHLVEKHFAGSLEAAVRATAKQLTGVFAFAVISQSNPTHIVAARSGPPVVIGIGKNEYFLASDVPAILAHTRDMFFLGDGNVAVIMPAGVRFVDFDGNPVHCDVQRVSWNAEQAEKGGYPHFMLKEIYDQPNAVEATTVGRVSRETGHVALDDMTITPEQFASFRRVKIVACGTSWHAGLAGRFMIEKLAGLPVEVDYGSEFRYRNPIVEPDTLTVVISQSGETADTLAALREAKARGSKTLAICNVAGSMIAREATGAMYTQAGPEIGVASTKAFTGQLTALVILAMHMGQANGHLSEESSLHLARELALLPDRLESVLSLDPFCEKLAKRVFSSAGFLFLGRGIHFPIALEAALKLKELSYIHAEGYPSGEMKHGPNALIDASLPVVVFATHDPSSEESCLLYSKSLSGIQEVKARDGIVIAVANEGDEKVRRMADYLIEIPAATDLLSPVLEIVPLQLLAYHIALLRGCDVDQPRNLAKSVTVE
jgi:glucosamine--fructose-6-phosphate aminotransferase (isomerizing)